MGGLVFLLWSSSLPESVLLLHLEAQVGMICVLASRSPRLGGSVKSDPSQGSPRFPVWCPDIVDSRNPA